MERLAAMGVLGACTWEFSALGRCRGACSCMPWGAPCCCLGAMGKQEGGASSWGRWREELLLLHAPKDREEWKWRVGERKERGGLPFIELELWTCQVAVSSGR